MDATNELNDNELLDLGVETETDQSDEIEKEVERRIQEKIENLRTQSMEELRTETFNRKLTQIFANEENTKDLKNFLKALSGNSKEVVDFILSNTVPVKLNETVKETKAVEITPVNITRDAVLAFLKTKWAPVSAEVIWKEMGISKEVLKEPLQSLVGLGIITTEGKRRGTKYVFIRETQQIAQAAQAAKALEVTQTVVASNEAESKIELESNSIEVHSIPKDNLVPIEPSEDSSKIQDEISSTTDIDLGPTDLTDANKLEVSLDEENEDSDGDNEPTASDLEF